MSKKLSIEEKYWLYENSVQSWEADSHFLNKEYKRIYKKSPTVLREDFGGTGMLACNWVKGSKTNKAFAVDLDPEPIKYGKAHHFVELNPYEQARMKYIEGNVLHKFNFKADIVVAFNFSYFIFKQRKMLVEYFKKAKAGLSKDGMFALDIFGGTEGFQPLIEKKVLETHTYFWDCDSYNPLTGEVMYYIHFKTKDRVKHEKVFQYDWRMWTVPEIKDALLDAGFSEVFTYWEGEDDDGSGDGEFKRSTKGTNCESWISYLVAIP